MSLPVRHAYKCLETDPELIQSALAIDDLANELEFIAAEIRGALKNLGNKKDP